MEKEVDHVLPFLDVLIDNTHRGSVVTSTFRKKTFTGLLTNYLSFAAVSYKIGLIRTLIDRVFKINNTWLGFHKDIVNLVFIFPVHLIDKCVYRYLNTAIDRNGSIQNTTSQGKQKFYKLPYLGRFSTIAQSKIRRLVNRYCDDLDIKLVFTSFKLRNLFSVFFNAWRREVCSNTANSTSWKDNSNLTSQNPPAPPCQLPVSYVTVLLMFWALIRVMVLLFVLVPSCLQYPVVQADRIKTWVLRNANKRLGQPFVFDCFVVFGNNTVNFGATDALFYTLKTLEIPTSTPKVSIQLVKAGFLI